MEENLSQNIPPPTPVGNVPPPPVSKPPFGSWWKVGMLVVGALLTASLLYAASRYSQKQPSIVTSPTRVPTRLPTPTPTPLVSLPTATPSLPDETANWKTYTNSAYSFSIKYPPDKKVETDEKNAIVNVCNNQKGIVDIRIYPKDYQKLELETDFIGDLWINISVVDNISEITLDNYINNYCPDNLSQDKISVMRKVLINGNPSLRIKYKNVRGDQAEAIIQKGKKFYVINAYAPKLLDNLFDQTLSTFQFLD